MLALPEHDRVTMAARIQASLAEHHGNVTAAARALKNGTAPRLMDLAGTGQGLWGEDSSEYLRQLRSEWP